MVFDLETTGINPNRDAIIEISAIKVIGNNAAEEFSTLVNPGRPIPKGATAVNGITDEMVADATNELLCPECGNALILRKGKYGAFYGCSGFSGTFDAFSFMK